MGRRRRYNRKQGKIFLCHVWIHAMHQQWKIAALAGY
jgi:hypothetical protein